MMEEKKRTIYHSLIVLFGTATIFLSGYAIVHSYDNYLQGQYALVPELDASSEAYDYDYDRTIQNSVNRLSRCANTCIFNQISTLGCAHLDYACMCKNFKVLGDPCVPPSQKQIDFRSCIEGCTLHDQWHSPGVILDICQAVDVQPVLPDFMYKNFRLHGREVSPSIGGDSQSLAFRSTVYTFTRTSTVAADATPGTSVNYDGGLVATEWIFVPSQTSGSSAGSPAGTTSVPGSNPTSSNPTPSSDNGSGSSGSIPVRKKSGGFPFAARIAVGVVIPVLLIILVLAVRWIWLRRKNGKTGEAATGDNSNPPGVAELENESHFPPAYPHAEYKSKTAEIANTERRPSSGGAQEMSSYETPNHGVMSATSGRAHEMSSYETPNHGAMSATSGIIPPFESHEMEGVDTARIELPDKPPQAYSYPPSIGRKPVSSGTSQFPAPWDYSQGDAYMPHEIPELGSSTDGSAIPQGSASNTMGGDGDLRAMEEEMAKIKAQKERLQSLSVLEEREAQLRRDIEARKGGG